MEIKVANADDIIDQLNFRLVDLAKEVGALKALVESLRELQTQPRYLKPIEKLNLSLRSERLLKEHGVVYIGDLVQCGENELKQIPLFGRKCFNEVVEALSDWHLPKLGTRLSDWPLVELKK